MSNSRMERRSGPPCRPMAPSTSAAGTVSPTMTARSRSTAGERGGVVARGTTGVQARVVGHRRVGRGSQAEASRDEIDHALGVVEVVAPGFAVPGRDLASAGQRDPQAPPLVGRIAILGRPVAL